MGTMSEQPDSREETVGERIRRLRRERGLSQRDICGPGISNAYISRIERGQRRPSGKALRLIGRSLGVSPEYLETGAVLTASEQIERELAEAELELRLGEPGEAERRFRAILSKAAESGNADADTRARVGLGVAAARRGAYRETVERLERVVDKREISPATHPDVYAALGQAYSELSEATKAVELFRQCLAEIEWKYADDEVLYIRFATYLSYALSDAGRPAEADAAIAGAISRTRGQPDPYTRIRLYWSRARIASDTGQHRLGLDSIRRAIGLLEQTEDSLHLGRAHLLCAEIVLATGDLDEAEEHLLLADALLTRVDTTPHLAYLRSEQAKLAARRGDGERALALAREAFALLGNEDQPEQGRAHWALAEAHVALGDHPAAERAFAAARKLLSLEGRYLPQLEEARGRSLRSAAPPTY
jgi:transcriptional regulator with XRE-family HTH domain